MLVILTAWTLVVLLALAIIGGTGNERHRPSRYRWLRGAWRRVAR